MNRVVLLVAALSAAVSVQAYTIESSYNAPDAQHSNDWWEYTLTVTDGDTSNENVFRVYMAWRIDPDADLTQFSAPSGWAMEGGDGDSGTYQAQAGDERSWVQWRYSETNVPTGTYTFSFMDNPDDAIDVYDHIGPSPGGQTTDTSTEVRYWYLSTDSSIYQHYGDHVPMTPEPSTVALMLLGGLGGFAVLGLRRRK